MRRRKCKPDPFARRCAQALLGAASALVLAPAPARAQDASGFTASNEEDVLVTARRREEQVQDVPVAVTVIRGDELEARGLDNVREAAILSPGLSINSDGAGRAFIAIRGIGVTVVQTVQPGVGLFVDGVYRPNTAYLNNPLLDVERLEILRGPQGAFYGKNTLGGAINVITRRPGDETLVRAIASFAGPDDSWQTSASISGPILTGLVSGRIAGSHREQDGFFPNILIGGDQERSASDSVNGTLVLTPPNLTVSINGYYDGIDAANVSYARVSGPADYSRDIELNAENRTSYYYHGVNGRLETTIGALNTDVTILVAYDARESETPDRDGDFGPDDIIRLSGDDELSTYTAELRFETEISSTLSALFGVFYSREETDAFTEVRNVARGVTNTTFAANEADTRAVFGTLFWRPGAAWEIALGGRYDREERLSTGAAIIGGVPVALADAVIGSDEVQPRLSLTRHWSPNFMTYASLARGYRGGGFNPPVAPVRTYQGDSVWTAELGAKWESFDGRFALSGAVFHSDYEDYIGLNSAAPSLAGGLVTIDLNMGNVESYGGEAEARWRPTDRWMLTASYAYAHSRITDDGAYTATTGRQLSSDRLTFQPDHQFSLTSDYEIPFGVDSIVLSVTAAGKGERLAATLNQTAPTFLNSYVLVNGHIAYRHDTWEFALFGDNLFGAEYFESYVEQTSLTLAGLPPSDLGYMGEDTRLGVRVSASF